jgi:hypothetical protein
LPVRPRTNTYGAGYEQAKQAIASRGKTFYAPKALAIRVAASRRPAISGIQSLSVARKIFIKFSSEGLIQINRSKKNQMIQTIFDRNRLQKMEGRSWRNHI